MITGLEKDFYIVTVTGICICIYNQFFHQHLLYKVVLTDTSFVSVY